MFTVSFEIKKGLTLILKTEENFGSYESAESFIKKLKMSKIKLKKQIVYKTESNELFNTSTLFIFVSKVIDYFLHLLQSMADENLITYSRTTSR